MRPINLFGASANVHKKEKASFLPNEAFSEM
jgi:hypothetical protein